MKTERLLIPLKFLSLILHLVISTTIFFTYADNIRASYPSMTTSNDSQFIQARVSVLFANSLTVILLSIEMILHFTGNNLFREKHNSFVTALHFLGVILYSQYAFARWNFYNLWYVFLACSILPFLLEVATAISSGLKYRRWN